MKKLVIPILLFVAVLGCSKDEDDNTLKGLVQFSEEPYYENEEIKFQAEIIYGSAGSPADVEFQVLDGDMVLLSEKAPAETNIDGIGFSFRTGIISITTPMQDFAGKELTIYLDPENKITQDQYTSEVNVNLYKKSSVTIPAQ